MWNWREVPRVFLKVIFYPIAVIAYVVGYIVYHISLLLYKIYKPRESRTPEEVNK